MCMGRIDGGRECEERQLEFGTLSAWYGHFWTLRVTLLRTPSDEGHGI